MHGQCPPFDAEWRDSNKHRSNTGGRPLGGWPVGSSPVMSLAEQPHLREGSAPKRPWLSRVPVLLCSTQYGSNFSHGQIDPMAK